MGLPVTCVADFPERAARIGQTNVLSRALAGIDRDVGETLYANIYVRVPDGEAVNEYPIRARVVAQGAAGEATREYVLRIGRAPNL